MLDGGVWNGKRIVSSAWLDQSLAPQINGEGLYFYGYQWWLGRSLVAVSYTHLTLPTILLV